MIKNPQESIFNSELNSGPMEKLKISIAHILFACLFFLISAGAIAQAPADLPSILERLTVQEGAKMTLETDLTTIIANKKNESVFPRNPDHGGW